MRDIESVLRFVDVWGPADIHVRAHFAGSPTLSQQRISQVLYLASSCISHRWSACWVVRDRVCDGLSCT